MQNLSPVLRHPQRLEAVRRLQLLDSPSDEAFDRLTRLASRILHAPVALVALVDEDRQVFKSCLGMPEPWASRREMPLSHAICHHMVASGEPLVVEDARAYAPLHHHPAVTELGVVGYLGIPLVTPGGHTLGSFCVIDRTPRSWTQEDIGLLRDLAASAMTEIDLRLAAWEAERKRREWQALLEASVEGVYGVDAEARCIYINRAATELLGYTAEECLGRNMHELAHYKRPDGSRYPIHECPMCQGFRLGTAGGFLEETLWRKDGSPLPALYGCAPLFEDGRAVAAVITITDIRQRRRDEEALRQRAVQLRQLADASLAINSAPSLGEMLDIITASAREIIGAHQAVTSVRPNPSAPEGASSVSFSDKYARNRGWSPPPGDPAVVGGLAVLERPACLTQSQLDAADHPELTRPLDPRSPPLRGLLTAPLVGGDGERIGGIGVSDRYEGDFTPEDEAILVQLAQLAGVAIENTRLLAAARDAVRDRNDFLSTVSHDLKNPLTTIKALAQLAARRASGAMDDAKLKRLKASLETIDQSADRMTQQLDELLDLARLQADEPLRLDIRPTDLAALARRVADEHRKAAPNHRIRVDAPSEVLGGWDPLRLERVLSNLLSNAVKYSPEGGEVCVRVAWSADAGGEQAVLTVLDHGIGIPAADLPHIFERFRRASNVAGVIAGTGIGLASARQIVEQHGGSIHAESREAAGATFTVRLPLSPRPVLLAEPPPADPS
jgi:PAS domain S-box-containing protein